MKYEAPLHLSEREIIDVLARSGTLINERIKAVISALYYGESVEFSGDILLEQFYSATGQYKRNLAQQFETFYGMCRTDYRINESIELLDIYRKEHPEYAPEVEATLEALIEYKEMFGKR